MKVSEQSKQQGFVAIIVAMFIMVFVTLLALGFAFLARQNREQNQNRALSTQAFYAAESGVNDAINYLSTYLKNNGTLPNEKADCGPIGTSPSDIGSSNTAVKYTCVLFNPAPKGLEYTISNKESRVIRVQSKSGRPFTSIKISWQDGQNSKQFATNDKHLLPQEAYTGTNAAPLNQDKGDNLAASTDILRATIIPAFGTIYRSALTTTSQTVFLYPKGQSSAPSLGAKDFLNSATDYNDANQGTFADGSCNTNNQPRYCNVNITNLTRFGGTSTFYIRLRGFYRPSTNVTISGITDDNAQAELMNEQAIVDSTGKADNVLRRIQVRVPLSTVTKQPEFAIETTDSQCKRLQVWPNDASIAALPDGNKPDACRAFPGNF